MGVACLSEPHAILNYRLILFSKISENSQLFFVLPNEWPFFLLLNPLTWTNFVSNFSLHPSLFILFTAFVLRKSTEQGKLEKSPRGCFTRPLPTTTPAPCTALPAAPAPSLNPQDFLKGTHLHFKHRFSSRPAQGTGTYNTEIPTSFSMSWIHCPRKSQMYFFWDSELPFLVLKQRL